MQLSDLLAPLARRPAQAVLVAGTPATSTPPITVILRLAAPGRRTRQHAIISRALIRHDGITGVRPTSAIMPAAMIAEWRPRVTAPSVRDHAATMIAESRRHRPGAAGYRDSTAAMARARFQPRSGPIATPFRPITGGQSGAQKFTMQLSLTEEMQPITCSCYSRRFHVRVAYDRVLTGQNVSAGPFRAPTGSLPVGREKKI